jgi:hypothetical protein
VQTGALIVQTEATRNNTETLRRIATNAGALQFAVLAAVVGLIVQQYENAEIQDVRANFEAIGARLSQPTTLISDVTRLWQGPLLNLLPDKADLITFLLILAGLLVGWNLLRFGWTSVTWLIRILTSALRMFRSVL